MGMDIKELTRAVAAPFIVANHYSGTAPTSDNLYFGCYVDDALFAVVNYGRLASRSSPAIILARDDATVANTLELRRMCRLGAKGKPGPVQLSDVLRECHERLLTKGYRYVLSYSDQAFNAFPVQFKNAKHKSGGIYKFSGFAHIGETSWEIHCEDAKGERVHRSRAYRRMLAHNISVCDKIKFKVEKKTTGNGDRIWPTDPALWATDDSLPADKLWKLDQVKRAMGLRDVKCPPKDKWLLDLELTTVAKVA